MKKLIFSALPLFSLLTVVEPIWAEEPWDLAETIEAETLVLNPRVNALFGVSDVAAEGHPGAGRAGGGLTLEVGRDWRTLETGAMMLPTGGQARSLSLALPMWAKFRVVSTEASGWYLKVGGMSAFETQSRRDRDTRNFDVLVSAGVGGRIRFTRWADVIVDATYNRGLLDHLRTSKGSDRQGGLVVFTGLSFPI